MQCWLALGSFGTHSMRRSGQALSPSPSTSSDAATNSTAHSIADGIVLSFLLALGRSTVRLQLVHITRTGLAGLQALICPLSIGPLADARFFIRTESGDTDNAASSRLSDAQSAFDVVEIPLIERLRVQSGLHAGRVLHHACNARGWALVHSLFLCT